MTTNSENRPPRMFTAIAATALVLGAAALLQGCPAGGTLDNAAEILAARGGATSVGDGDAGDGDSGPCNAEPLFESCGSSSCHEGEDSGGGTNLILEDYAALIDAPATYKEVKNPDDCPDMPEFIIDSANPENSLLVRKLRGTMACGDGMPVPFSLAPWEEEKIACVESWIEGLLATGATGGGGMETGGDGTGGTEGTDGTGGTSGMAPADLSLDFVSATGVGTMPVVGADGMADSAVGYFDADDTVTFTGVMVDGFNQVTVVYSKLGAETRSVEIRLGSETGTLLGTLAPEDTLDWNTYVTSDPIALSETLSGTQDIVFVGKGGMSVVNLDSVTFSAAPVSQ